MLSEEKPFSLQQKKRRRDEGLRKKRNVKMGTGALLCRAGWTCSWKSEMLHRIALTTAAQLEAGRRNLGQLLSSVG